MAFTSNFISYRLLTTTYFTVAYLYSFYPLVIGSEHLPTPIVYKGVPDTEYSLITFLVLYALLFVNAYKLAYSAVSNECFFAMSVFIFGNRFATIKDLLKLLNYSGPRDKKKDKEIIKMCYMMHLELYE